MAFAKARLVLLRRQKETCFLRNGMLGATRNRLPSEWFGLGGGVLPSARTRGSKVPLALKPQLQTTNLG